MNDKIFIKRKIRSSLSKLIEKKHFNKHELHRLNVLSHMVSGILLSGRSEISQIALASNEGKKKHTSQKKQFKRFIENKHFNYRTHYFPFALAILRSLSKRGHLEFSIDGSVAGRGCMVLMFSVIYKGKAIPIVWSVYKAKKGHLPQQAHRDLLVELKKLIPSGCEVTLLGDGEFDGCHWLEDIVGNGWNYVVRTGKNKEFEEEEGECFKAGKIGVGAENTFFIEAVKFTKKRFGPVNLLIWHDKKHKEPIILISNLEYVPDIKQLYKKRFKIEPFFRDQKSKGFNIQKSGLGNPERIAKLLIASCLAYVLCILGGLKALNSKFYDIIAEQNRKALSLFQLGLRFLRLLVDLRQWRTFSWEYDLQV